MSFIIHQGDALETLRTLANASADCCITSPPYWGLRDYGVSGQLGLESDPEEYIEKLVLVFREVRRVLRPDGTVWLNLGDSYAGLSKNQILSAPPRNPGRNPASFRRDRADVGVLRHKDGGLKPKDLIGIPWRVALALQGDGWWLRSDIIWSKPNPMPESITDRPTKSHEYVFLLATAEKYYYDAEAIREKCKPAALDRVPASWHQGTRPATPSGIRDSGKNAKTDPQAPGRRMMESTAAARRNGAAHDAPFGETRNKRSVWTIPTLATPEAHFATFPIELPEICLLAGTPEGGTVLDPFAGAGTTGLACLRNSRNFVGIELSPEYIRIAEKRARKYYPLLFGAAAV